MIKRLAIAACAVLVAAAAAAQTFNQRAVVSTSGSGDRTVITGLAGKSIMVYGFDLFLSGSSTLKLKCGSTDLTGAMTMTAWSKPIVQAPAYFVCAGGSNLIINLGNAVSTGGILWYAQQ